MGSAFLNRNGGTTILDLGHCSSPLCFNVEKTVVKIADVQERVSVARTYRKTPGSGLSVLAGITGAEVVQTLKTDEATYKQEMSESASRLKVADEAVQFTGEEFSEKHEEQRPHPWQWHQTCAGPCWCLRKPA